MLFILALHFVSYYVTGIESISSQGRKYDIQAESFKIFREDFDTVLARFKRSSDYVTILKERVDNLKRRITDNADLIYFATIKKLNQQIEKEFKINKTSTTTKAKTTAETTTTTAATITDNGATQAEEEVSTAKVERMGRKKMKLRPRASMQQRLSNKNNAEILDFRKKNRIKLVYLGNGYPGTRMKTSSLRRKADDNKTKVELLDDYIKKSKLTMEQKNKMVNLGFEHAGDMIHWIIKSVGGTWNGTDHVAKHEVTTTTTTTETPPPPPKKPPKPPKEANSLSDKNSKIPRKTTTCKKTKTTTTSKTLATSANTPTTSADTLTTAADILTTSAYTLTTLAETLTTSAKTLPISAERTTLTLQRITEKLLDNIEFLTQAARH